MCWDFNASGFVSKPDMENVCKEILCVCVFGFPDFSLMCELTELSYTLWDLHYYTHTNKVLLNKEGDWYCYSNLKFLEMKVIF